MINEALAEEVRREEQMKKRSDRAAAEAPETELTAPAASEPREDPIESNPNPKRRLLMKSASKGRQSQMMSRECKLKTSRRSIMKREQSYPRYRRQTPDEELQ